MDYVSLLPRAFKQFGLRSAVKTALPTAWYYVKRPRLAPSEKPALFTMNILPPMMTVWHHCVRKYLGDRVDVTIFDSSAGLNPRDFEGTRVQKFINVYAATKSEEFIRSIARNRRITWLCDDDIFLLSGETIDVLEREFVNENTAAVSFRPRPWWHFEIDGQEYEPISSYCTAFNRDILIEKENLHLGPADGNNHPSHNGKPPKRYDTCDLANEQLLRKGYDCIVIPQAESDRYIAEFSGLSGGVMLLNYFKTPEQVLEYYETPPKQQWSGNMLFGTLTAVLTISYVQEAYQAITGKEYPLPSLPKRSEITDLFEKHAQYFRAEFPQQLATVHSEAQKLLAHL